MANPLLKINQPADVKLGQKGSLNLGICWKADLAGRYTEAFVTATRKEPRRICPAW